MDYRASSSFADHPRITWFGTGAVAYVDYAQGGTLESFFVGTNRPDRGFKVVPPASVARNREYTGFRTMDEAIAWALNAAEGER